MQQKYTFNSFGQLTRVDKYVSGAFNSNLGQYYYDANGARAKVTEGGASTTYIYAGHDPMYQVGADGKGYKYIYVGGSLQLRVYDAGEKYAYLGDALGSTRKVLSNGQIGTVTFSAATYKPFGVAVTTVGSDKLTYASEMKDQTGLFYLFARYYEPELGRFISLDPELGKPSQPQTLNRFVYCANSPLIHTDPTGRIFGLNILIGAIVGAVVNTVVAVIQQKSLAEIGQAALMGAITGAVAGATFGLGMAALAGSTGATAAASTTTSVLRAKTQQGLMGWAKVSAVNFASGAMGSMSGDVADSMLNGKRLDLGQVAQNAVIGGGISAVSYFGLRGLTSDKVAPSLRTPLGKPITENYGGHYQYTEGSTNPFTGQQMGPLKWISQPPTWSNVLGGVIKGFSRAGLRSFGY